jgi:hypothetical protein
MESGPKRRVYLAVGAILLQAFSLVTPWILVSQGGGTHTYNAFNLVSTSTAGLVLCLVALIALLIESSRSRTWHYSAAVFSIGLFISLVVVCVLEIGSSFTPKLLVPVVFQRAWFAAGAGFGGWLYVLGSVIGLAVSVDLSSRSQVVRKSTNAWKLSSNRRTGSILIVLAAILGFTCRYLNWFSVDLSSQNLAFQGWVFPQISQTTALCTIGWLIVVALIPKIPVFSSLLSILFSWLALTSCALVFWAGLGLAQTVSALDANMQVPAASVSLGLGVWVALLASILGTVGSIVTGLGEGRNHQKHFIESGEGSQPGSQISQDYLL